jgi:hypothetical protein
MGGGAEPWVYTDVEEHALGLAAELRDRVERERAVVRRLQAYLGGDKWPDPPE